MIRINQNWLIDVDSNGLCYHLVKEHNVTDRKTNKIKRSHAVEGYYGNIQSLMNGLVQQDNRNLTGTAKTLEEVVSNNKLMLDALHSEFAEAMTVALDRIAELEQENEELKGGK